MDDLFEKTEKFWNRFKKNPIKTFAISCVILVVLIGSGFFDTLGGSLVSSDKNKSGRIEVNGGNNQFGDHNTQYNTNSVAEYTWTNKDSWVVESGQYGPTVYLKFTSNGPITPPNPCIFIISDAEIASVIPKEESLLRYKENKPMEVRQCYNKLGTDVLVEILFKTNPKWVGGELFEPSKRPMDNSNIKSVY